MKNLPPFIRYFLVGVFLAFTFHLIQASSCFDGIVNPTNDELALKIEENANKVQNAFLAADTTQLKELMTETALATYSELFPDMVDKMNDFGELMKTKELTVYNDIYAEYTIIEDGLKFTIAFSRQDDDSWKLMTF